jgi:hypothetical protein
MMGFADHAMFTRRALVVGSGTAAATVAEDLARVSELVVSLASPDAAWDEPDIVVSAAAPELADDVLRRAIASKVPVADMHAPLQDALALDALAREKQQAVCVRCSELARLLGAAPSDERAAALVTAALARRLLTGDFRPHWGLWSPEHLLSHPGLAHGIREDLRERGLELRA